MEVLMSLAELFYRKNPHPSVWSALRRRNAFSAQSVESQFVLENLEPRFLMSAGSTGVTEVLVQTGDPAPASGGQSGGTFSVFGVPSINEAGQMAFFGSVTGATSTQGNFLITPTGTVTALVRTGEAAPPS